MEHKDTYLGVPLEEMSKKELIEALRTMSKLYNDALGLNLKELQNDEQKLR